MLQQIREEHPLAVEDERHDLSEPLVLSGACWPPELIGVSLETTQESGFMFHLHRRLKLDLELFESLIQAQDAKEAKAHQRALELAKATAQSHEPSGRLSALPSSAKLRDLEFHILNAPRNEVTPRWMIIAIFSLGFPARALVPLCDYAILTDIHPDVAAILPDVKKTFSTTIRQVGGVEAFEALGAAALGECLFRTLDIGAIMGSTWLDPVPGANPGNIVDIMHRKVSEIGAPVDDKVFAMLCLSKLPNQAAVWKAFLEASQNGALCRDESMCKGDMLAPYGIASPIDDIMRAIERYAPPDTFPPETEPTREYYRKS
jgi:hypothetical protein